MTGGTGNKLIPLIPALLILIAGCGGKTVYTDTITMPSEVWTLTNVAEFRPEIKDTSSLNDIIITIRTGTSYPFRNIWLFTTTKSPSGAMIGDTLEFMLADEKGKWYGRGFGDIHELKLPFRNRVFFPEKGTYVFTIRHGMRAEDLKGVYDLGLRIEKSE